MVLLPQILLALDLVPAELLEADELLVLEQVRAGFRVRDDVRLVHHELGPDLLTHEHVRPVHLHRVDHA